MSRLAEDKRYRLGQYMTPPNVAACFFDHVVEPVGEWRVLDPACGNGNLLVAAAERLMAAGVPDVAERLCGVDVDPGMVESTTARLSKLLNVPKQALNVTTGDYLAGGVTLFDRPDWASFEP